MIAEVHSRIWGDAYTSANVSTFPATAIYESTGNATFGMLFCDNAMKLHVKWETTTNPLLMRLPKPSIEFMWTAFGPHVRFCTKYVRDQYTVRCHPAYQSDNLIYDLMNVLFEIKGEKTKTYVETTFPCWLAAVVIRNVDALNPDPYRLVVQSITKKTSIKSVLLTEWCWSDEYLVILPLHIVGPCFVISIKPDMSKILETLPLEKWAAELTKPVDDASSSSSSDDIDHQENAINNKQWMANSDDDATNNNIDNEAEINLYEDDDDEEEVIVDDEEEEDGNY